METRRGKGSRVQLDFPGKPRNRTKPATADLEKIETTGVANLLKSTSSEPNRLTPDLQPERWSHSKVSQNDNTNRRTEDEIHR